MRIVCEVCGKVQIVDLSYLEILGVGIINWACRYCDALNTMTHNEYKYRRDYRRNVNMDTIPVMDQFRNPAHWQEQAIQTTKELRVIYYGPMSSKRKVAAMLKMNVGALAAYAHVIDGVDRAVEKGLSDAVQQIVNDDPRTTQLVMDSDTNRDEKPDWPPYTHNELRESALSAIKDFTPEKRCPNKMEFMDYTERVFRVAIIEYFGDDGPIPEYIAEKLDQLFQRGNIVFTKTKLQASQNRGAMPVLQLDIDGPKVEISGWAHEFGHGLHMIIAEERAPLGQSIPNEFIAETVATTFEILFLKKAMESYLLEAGAGYCYRIANWLDLAGKVIHAQSRIAAEIVVRETKNKIGLFHAMALGSSVGVHAIWRQMAGNVNLIEAYAEVTEHWERIIARQVIAASSAQGKSFLTTR